MGEAGLFVRARGMDTEQHFRVGFAYQRRGKLHRVTKRAPRKCRNMAEAQEWALGVCLRAGYRLEAIRKEPPRPQRAASYRHLLAVIKNTIDRLINH
jgi:hypothetical protein